MKKRIRRLMFSALLLTSMLPAVVFAQSGIPEGALGNCPPGFEFHMPMDHDHEGDPMHHHAGTMADKNGDGWICVKHATPTGKVHVHIDNALPLP